MALPLANSDSVPPFLLSADVPMKGGGDSGLGNLAAASGPSLRTSALKASISLLMTLHGIRVSTVRCASVSGSANASNKRCIKLSAFCKYVAPKNVDTNPQQCIVKVRVLHPLVQRCSYLTLSACTMTDHANEQKFFAACMCILVGRGCKAC